MSLCYVLLSLCYALLLHSSAVLPGATALLACIAVCKLVVAGGDRPRAQLIPQQA